MNTTTYGEMIDTLREAQHVVRTDVEWFEQARGQDSDVLLRLDRSVRSLTSQTDSLLVLMTDRGVAEVLIEVAKELLGFFSDTEERISVLLRTAELEEPQPCAQSRVH